VSAIVFEGVKRVFQRDGRDFPTLDGIDLTVAEREFVAIVGPSGCGKTTCLRMVAGLEFPTHGKVTVGGATVDAPGPDRAVVFQQFALFPWKTVAENIEFGLKSKGVANGTRSETIARFVELMGLQGYESAFPHQLSGGMQQRVAIARAYALDPAVLLMDEPFGALDTHTKIDMHDVLLRIWEREQQSVLFVTHDLGEALTLADRIILLSARPGRIKDVFEVDFARPRDAVKVSETPRYAELFQHIWHSLGEEFLRARAS